MCGARGAKTAMTVALGSADLVESIIAVDNAPVDAAISSDFGSYIQGMKEIEAAQVERMDEADKILEQYEKVSHRQTPRWNGSSRMLISWPAANKSIPIRQFLLGNMYRPAGSKARKFRLPLDVLHQSVNLMGDFPFKDPDAARFNKRALFIRGTKSRYVPDEVLPAIGRFFPRFELVDIDAGHWVTSENPGEFKRGRSCIVDFDTRMRTNLMLSCC
jgi:pimeloyl-ACP methyl ester carboxylesterase